MNYSKLILSIFALLFSYLCNASLPVPYRTKAQLLSIPLVQLYEEYRKGVKLGMDEASNSHFLEALTLHEGSFSSHWQVIASHLRRFYVYGAEFHPDAFTQRFKSHKERTQFFERHSKNYEEKLRIHSMAYSPRILTHTEPASIGGRISSVSYVQEEENLRIYAHLKKNVEELSHTEDERYFKVQPSASPFHLHGGNTSRNRGKGESVIVIDDFSISYWNDVLFLPFDLQGKISDKMRVYGLKRVYFRRHSFLMTSLIASQYGYAPQAKIIPIEWDVSNRSFSRDIRALPTSARVVNISLSNVKFNTLEVLCPGRIVVLSAGNASRNISEVHYWTEIREGLAREPWMKNHLVIALAVEPGGRTLTNFSNFSGDDDDFQDISFCIGGEDIKAHAPIWTQFSPKVEEISGTSVSAALLSGMIGARFSDHPEEEPADVIMKLRKSTHKIGDKRYSGRGLVDASQFLE